MTDEPQPDIRTANLLGALVVALGDALRDATEAASAHGAMAPAALATIANSPGESLDSLRRTLRLTPSGAGRLVDRLQADGLVERRPAASGDGRAIALVLTGKGQRVADALLVERRRVLEHALELLSPAERQALTPVLEKLLYGLVPDREHCDHTCRLCDFDDCPQDICPVEQAAIQAEQGGEHR
jgi:DNA-binding MarR family transcriptional regulator